MIKDLSSLAGPRLHVVEVEDHSFPVVNCRFSNAIFHLKYGEREDRFGKLQKPLPVLVFDIPHVTLTMTHTKQRGARSKGKEKRAGRTNMVPDCHVWDIKYYGTHYLMEVTFGAQFMENHKVSQTKYEELRSTKRSVEMQAAIQE